MIRKHKHCWHTETIKESVSPPYTSQCGEYQTETTRKTYKVCCVCGESFEKLNGESHEWREK